MDLKSVNAAISKIEFKDDECKLSLVLPTTEMWTEELSRYNLDQISVKLTFWVAQNKLPLDKQQD